MKRINSMIKHDLRKSLCNKYDGCCAYCGKQIGMAGTIDHYLPEALGGTNARSNLRWCCTECNGLKADMHPDEWELVKPPRIGGTTKAQRRLELLCRIAPFSRERVGDLCKG